MDFLHWLSGADTKFLFLKTALKRKTHCIYLSVCPLLTSLTWLLETRGFISSSGQSTELCSQKLELKIFVTNRGYAGN